ncbi:hypothetical protein T08_16388 [Trichinella sp. T8]|nr:hypothetical protein T08_16388 [Trichinella sp. T8]
MLSGKRKSERKGNPPVNTGPSPFSDECANSAVEEVNEPARGSGSLRSWGKKEANDSVRSILIQRADDALIPVYVSRNTADVQLRSSLLKPHLGLGSPERRKLQ